MLESKVGETLRRAKLVLGKEVQGPILTCIGHPYIFPPGDGSRMSMPPLGGAARVDNLKGSLTERPPGPMSCEAIDTTTKGLQPVPA